jgi:glutamate-5-semialdehyde dehydrogenase
MNKYDLYQIKQSFIKLNRKSEKERNLFLLNLIKSLKKNKEKIIRANNKDLDIASKNGLSSAFLDRLKFQESEFLNTISQVKATIHLKSGIGEILEKRNLLNGTVLKKVSVPIGIILVIFESRPEVVIDVISLCIKSGNAIILKGGSEALNTIKVFYECVKCSLAKTHFPELSVELIENKKQIYNLIGQKDIIDLVIARGGYQMVEDIVNKSKVPVLAHSAGGARIYVDASANLEKALKIIVNAKVSKPSACNSLDTVLISEKIAPIFLPELIARLKSYHVEIFTDKKSDDFWDEEFLSLKIGIKIVKGIEEAVDFICRFGKLHSEGIIAKDKKVISLFTKAVDAAGIFVNCSTRLHDGGVFGMGTEMGISTGKLHARGPVGLRELTTYKYIIEGKGQIRD